MEKETIVIIDEKLDIRNPDLELNRLENRNFKKAEAEGLYTEDNDYFTIQVLDYNIESKEDDDSSLRKMKLEIIKLEFNPLGKISNPFDYLLKAYSIGNQLNPRGNAMVFPEPLDTFSHLIHHHLERNSLQGFTYRILNIQRFSDTAVFFKIHAHNDKGESFKNKLVLTLDLFKRVGYEYRSNNGCVGRESLYFVELKRLTDYKKYLTRGHTHFLESYVQEEIEKVNTFI